MKNRRTRIGTAWAFRAAMMVAGLVASIGFPATAGAATPASSHGEAATTRTTRPSPAATSSDAPTPTTSADTDTRTSTTATSSERDEASRTPTMATPPAAAVDEAGWVLAVRPAALTVRVGQNAIFTAAFTSSGPSASPITVQWQSARSRKGPWTDLRGSSSTVLTSTATLTMDGDLFRAVVTTDQESSRSASVILHVQPPLDTPSATPAATTPIAKEPYGTVALPVLGRGQEQTAIGHNFPPGTMVRVTVEPTGVDLGTYLVDPDGVVTTHFSTRSLKPGPHTVRWTPA